MLLRNSRWTFTLLTALLAVGCKTSTPAPVGGSWGTAILGPVIGPSRTASPERPPAEKEELTPPPSPSPAPQLMPPMGKPPMVPPSEPIEAPAPPLAPEPPAEAKSSSGTKRGLTLRTHRPRLFSAPDNARPVESRDEADSGLQSPTFSGNAADKFRPGHSRFEPIPAPVDEDDNESLDIEDQPLTHPHSTSITPNGEPPVKLDGIEDFDESLFGNNPHPLTAMDTKPIEPAPMLPKQALQLPEIVPYFPPMANAKLGTKPRPVITDVSPSAAANLR